MLYIQESIRIEAPIAVAWAWMSDLERLMQGNEFHVAMRFETDQRRGKGTCVLIDHSFFGSAPEARGARVTHWEEGAGKVADRLLRDVFASRVVRRECAYLKEHIEEFAAGWKAGRAAA